MMNRKDRPMNGTAFFLRVSNEYKEYKQCWQIVEGIIF